jgi:hypothetical protein
VVISPFSFLTGGTFQPRTTHDSPIGFASSDSRWIADPRGTAVTMLAEARLPGAGNRDDHRRAERHREAGRPPPRKGLETKTQTGTGPIGQTPAKFLKRMVPPPRLERGTPRSTI